jgi:hypothetical protein
MDPDMPTTREDELKPIAKGPSRRPTTEQGRQGQNVRGMLTVLFVSIALAVVGFGAIYVFNQPPQTPAATSAPSTTTTPPPLNPPG